jgi:hypothetical protein
MIKTGYFSDQPAPGQYPSKILPKDPIPNSGTVYTMIYHELNPVIRGSTSGMSSKNSRSAHESIRKPYLTFPLILLAQVNRTQRVLYSIASESGQVL